MEAGLTRLLTSSVGISPSSKATGSISTELLQASLLKAVEGSWFHAGETCNTSLLHDRPRRLKNSRSVDVVGCGLLDMIPSGEVVSPT